MMPTRPHADTFPTPAGSFVPFTSVARCSTEKAMEKSSENALDRALVEACEELEFDWPEFLPVERIRTGIFQIAFGLCAFGALVAFCFFF